MSTNIQMRLFEQEEFQTQLEQFTDSVQQDWQEIVPAAANETMAGKTIGVMGIGLATTFAAMGAVGIASLFTGFYAVGWLAGIEVVGVIGSMYLGEAKKMRISVPKALRKAKLPQARRLQAKLEVDKQEGAVTAVVCDQNNDQHLQTFELGQHDQEEIANRFLTLQQLCQQINEQAVTDAQTVPQLMIQNNLRPNGKILNRKDDRVRGVLHHKSKKPTPDVDHQIEQQNKQLTVTTNQQLVKALEQGQS